MNIKSTIRTTYIWMSAFALIAMALMFWLNELLHWGLVKRHMFIIKPNIEQIVEMEFQLSSQGAHIVALTMNDTNQMIFDPKGLKVTYSIANDERTLINKEVTKFSGWWWRGDGTVS